jgi:hypothetical protein
MAETVRERLEKLKERKPYVNMPLSRDDLNPQPTKKLLTPESVFIKKIDKMANHVINLKKKMHKDSGSYLSLYYDLKKAEKTLLNTIEDPEIQFMDLPQIWIDRIENIKAKLLAKK